MNAFFVIDGVLVTPQNERKTFLNGITRDSILQTAADLGIPTEERDITIDELLAYSRQGLLQEAFGTGTAAVIAPVEEIGYYDEQIILPDVDTWQVGPRIKAQVQAIRDGSAPDTHGWMYSI